jgi:hypothetical protein
MTEAPKTTGMQRFRNGLNEIYDVVLWLWWILFGWIFSDLGFEPAWIGPIIIVIGVVGLIAKAITLARKVSVFYLVEAVANFCLAACLAVGFFSSMGADSNWIIGVGAVLAILLGIGELARYKKSKATLPPSLP